MQFTIDYFKHEYSFLSNFHPVKIEIDGFIFPSVEHAFVAMKSIDQNFWIDVIKQPNPGKVKKMGRKVNLRPNWDEYKIPLMKKLLIIQY